jgi:hypothetical protein
MHALIQLQPDASLYQSHFKYIDRNGTFIRYSRLLPATVTSVDLLKLLLTRGIDTMGTGYMMRSEDYDRLGGISYHYPKLLFADHELWLKLSDINKMAVCDKSCFSYRLHDNTSALADPVSYQDAFFHFLDFLHLYISKDLKFKQELDADIDSYIIYFAESLAHRLLRFPMRDRNNIRVADFFSKCKRVSRLFHFDGREVEFIKFESILPLLIDSNSITRRLFLLWKLTFPRPLFK